METYKKRIILHVDGDSFFASVEQAKDWRLRGRPVITGGEKYIATSMSYEAKAKGVYRGMQSSEIRKACPDAVFIKSDYITYGIFARRMYSIVRNYTQHVEEYSIDECFADITGLDQKLGISYEEIGQRIKMDLESKLGITFGVGLAPSKVLAKVASKFRKPSGFTYIPPDTMHIDGMHREIFLRNLSIEKVWGIGTASTVMLRSNGIKTALDFATLTNHQLSALNISKPYRAIHHELNGMSVMAVHEGPHEMPKSIMCTKTFYPASRDLETVFSNLSKNIEEACEKLRHHKAKAKEFSIYLKSQDFRYYRYEHRFESATDDSFVFMAVARKQIGDLFKKHLEYRSTGIALRNLISIEDQKHKTHTVSLFENIENASTAVAISEAIDDRHIAAHIFNDHSALNDHIDKLNRKFGEHSVMFGSTLKAIQTRQAREKAEATEWKKKNRWLKGGKNTGTAKNKEGQERVWEIPFLGTVK